MSIHEQRKGGDRRTRRQFLRASAGLTAVALAPAVRAAGEPIALDGTKLGRTFEGIGALSAGASSRLLIDYPERARARVLDLLFKPNFGASLHHLKVEIGGDVNSTDGTEPSHMHTRDDENYERGYEWWLMKEAKRRNPALILDCLAWGAPGWIGNGNYFSPDMADYIVKFIQGARDHHGLVMDYVGIWNESNYNVEWIKLLKRTLIAHGLATKIVAADQTPANRRGLWGIARDMVRDPELAAAVDVVGVHYPAVYRGGRSPGYAQRLAQPLWASEEGFSQRRLRSSDFATALFLARAYNQVYVRGAMTKTVVWALVTSYSEGLPFPDAGLMRANEPWSGFHEVHPPVWATAHTTQFTAPGWKYLGGPACADLPAGGSHVALKDPAGEDFSLIIETGGARASQEAAFALGPGLSAAPIRVWKSDRTAQFQLVDELRPADGKINLRVEPDSIYTVTTTTGQSKGEAAPAERTPFPLPYSDDFAAYPPGAAPRYFSDWAGVFTVADRPGGGGKCLGQVIVGKGIDWNFVRTPEPLTLLGAADWADYEVSADCRLEEVGSVSVWGRVRRVSLNPLNSAPIAGYELRLQAGGQWLLLAGGRQLAGGAVPFAPDRWARLALRFAGPEIRALIDGNEVARRTDSRFPAGLAGLGSGRHRAWFANFRAAKI